MGTDRERFREHGERRLDFIDEVLVECPRCQECAVHRPVGPVEDRPGAMIFAPRRLVCSSCGYTKDWAERSLVGLSSTEPFDDYFALPIWLQERCGGEVIWAYNERHLSFLESYLGARLRERSADPEHGWSNRSMASRLPAWMKKASARDDVVRALSKMRAKLRRTQ